MALQGRRATVSVKGRVLYLTADASELEAQLAGERLTHDPGRVLLDNISTDEITPGWVCYYYDEEIARYCLVGLRSGVVKRDAIAAGGFEVVVSGASKGCGSSRETAPYAEREAGIRVVVARSFEKIYQQNAQNIGLLTSTDFGVVERLERGESIAIEEFTRGLDPISAAVVEQGGLFAYNRERIAGRIAPPAVVTAPRAMTLCEKILAAHAVDHQSGMRSGVEAVAPGDALFARCDVRFSHEYVTAMAESLMRQALGQVQVLEPHSVYAFRDHLTFLDDVMPEEHVRLGLHAQARSLAVVQEQFASRHSLALWGEVQRDGLPAGSEAICHNKIIESVALPGQVVVGTDSHTCMAGALGCFAFGVGSTDMANAWFTADVRVRVPETIRVDLGGSLRPGVAAKDVMLRLLSMEPFRSGGGIGKVIEFGGEGLAGLGIDERATLANMSVEAGGFTGIMEADEVVVEALARLRGIAPEEIRRLAVRADPDASYAERIAVALGQVEPMVATPGDPRNGIPLGELVDGEPVRIDIAYAGSCTGGKRADMDMYASVLRRALAKGRGVRAGVAMFIQFGSQLIRRYAEEQGYLELFHRAGATLLEPSCGACIRAGPGVSTRPEQVTISAVNRNYPGRSGPGRVYLASPYVVAASAVLGRIGHPDEI